MANPRRKRQQVKQKEEARLHAQREELAQSTLSSKESSKVPRSAVFRRGKVDASVVQLIQDLRKVMCPHTALKLKEESSKKRKYAKLSNYASVLSSAFGVTHLLAFTQNDEHVNLRLARTPNGPTLTFRVEQFSLMKHVVNSQKRPYNFKGMYSDYGPPIVVTNNFGGSGDTPGLEDVPPQVKLMRITFQHLFPPIDVAEVRLKDCRRVLMFHLIKNTPHDDKDQHNDKQNDNPPNIVELRHYAIRASPVGLNRPIRKLLQTTTESSKPLPNLSQLDHVSDYVLGQGAGPSAVPPSDSEASEDEASHVVLPQSYHGQGNLKSHKSALKLIELGPRLRLSLLKIERELEGGDVMYHSYLQKSPLEAKQVKNKVEEQKRLKRQRREEQEKNVERKKMEKEEKKRAKERRREERQEEVMEELRRGGAVEGLQEMKDDVEEEEEEDSEVESEGESVDGDSQSSEQDEDQDDDNDDDEEDEDDSDSDSDDSEE